MTPTPTPAAADSTPAAAGPPDPWELTPEQQAELDAKTARTRAELAAIPDWPPF